MIDISLISVIPRLGDDLGVRESNKMEIKWKSRVGEESPQLNLDITSYISFEC